MPRLRTLWGGGGGAASSPGGGSGSGLPSAVVTKTAAYTAVAGEFVQANTTTAGFTVTLPTAPATGALVAVKKVSADTNTLTIAAAGGGTIDGTATATTVTQWAGVVLEHTGSNVWRVAASMSTTGPAGTNGTNGTNGAISLLQDEGTSLTVRSTVNFVGAGVTATDDAANSRTLVTIPGGGSGGGGGLIPRALAPGRYYAMPGQVASLTMSAGYRYATPFEVFASTSFTAIGLNIQTLQTSSVVRLGIYAADSTTGLPSTLVLDAGTIDGATTGNKEVAITQTLAAGVYWLVARSTGNSATPYAIAALPAMFGSTTQAGIMQNPSSGYVDAGGGTGALESTWGATVQSTPFVPKIALKTA